MTTGTGISWVSGLWVSMCLWESTFLGAAEWAVKPGQDAAALFRELKPGDVLVVEPGVYDRQWTIAGLKGSAEAPIVIRGKDWPIFRPAEGRDGILFWGEASAHVVVEGLRFENAPRAGLIVFGSSHITIRNCTFASNGIWGVQTCLSDFITVEDCDISGSRKEHGIYFSTTDHPVARNNRIYHNSNCGIHFNGDGTEGGDGMITGGRVEGNWIHDNGSGGGAAINMDGVEDTLVCSNRLENNQAGGIVSFSIDGRESGSRNVFQGNRVVFGPGRGRYGIKLTGTPAGVQVISNQVVCGRGPALEVDESAVKGLRSDGNTIGVLHRNGLIRVGDRRLSLEEWRALSGQDRHSTESARDMPL